MKRVYTISLIVFLILFLDQALKIWVKTHLQYGEEINILGLEWARIHFVENPGMAFGITPLGGTEMGKLLLSIFRIIAVVLLWYFIANLIKLKANWGVLLSFAFIMAGAIGNILDSAFYGLIFSSSPFHGGVATLFPPEGGYAGFLYGKVVDMFYFPVWEGYFPDWMPLIGGNKFMFFKPVFNLADVAITAGVLNILLFQRSFFTKAKEADAATTEKTDIPLEGKSNVDEQLEINPE